MAIIDDLNKFAEFVEIAEFVDDETFTDALAKVVKIITNPDIPPPAAVKLIVLLQAYSAKFSMLASYYANVKKENRAKKNLYFSMAKALDDLVSSLKYMVKG